MSNNIQKRENGGINPLVAAMAGVAVGVGAAVAGAVVLSDKDNRDKVKKAVGSVSDRATSYVDGVKEKIQDKRDDAGEKVDETHEKVKKTLSEAKN